MTNLKIYYTVIIFVVTDLLVCVSVVKRITRPFLYVRNNVIALYAAEGLLYFQSC